MIAPLHPLVVGRRGEVLLTLGGRIVRGRPLSAEAVLRFEAASVGASPPAVAAAKLVLFRRVFPLRWSALWRGDPARQLLADPAGEGIIASLFQPPPWPKDAPPAPAAVADPWAAVDAANRDPLADEPSGAPAPTIALALVALQVEYFFGARWYHDPERWPTVDGFAPLTMVWAAHRGLSSVWALERLNTMASYHESRAPREVAERVRERIVREAFHG